MIFDRQRGSNGEQYLTSLDLQRTARVGDTRLTVVTAGRPTDFATPVVTASSDFTLLEMQSDGNLVVYTAGGQALWSSLFGRTY